ncbi:MAG: hypothetical protein HRU41_42100 [Saprospiraceae bacterium]|nr:hypothetical protein [Saprospiraceae bacterium]
MDGSTFNIIDNEVVEIRTTSDLKTRRSGIALDSFQEISFKVSNQVEVARKLLAELYKLYKQSDKLRKSLDLKAPDLKGFSNKFTVLIEIWGSQKILSELDNQRSKGDNSWLASASGISELLELTLSLTKASLVANLKIVEFATILRGQLQAAENIRRAINKISAGFAVPLAILSLISDGIKLIFAIQSRDPIAIVEASGNLLTASLTLIAAVSSIGTSAAITAFTMGGASLAAGVISLAIALVKMADMLGGWIKRIRDNTLRKSVTLLWKLGLDLGRSGIQLVTATAQYIENPQGSESNTPLRINLEVYGHPATGIKKTENELDKKRIEKLQQIIGNETGNVNALLDQIGNQWHEVLKNTKNQEVTKKLSRRRRKPQTIEG